MLNLLEEELHLEDFQITILNIELMLEDEIILLKYLKVPHHLLMHVLWVKQLLYL